MTDAIQLVLDKLSGWLDSLILLLPNLVVAILVTLLASIVAKLVKKAVRRTMHRLTRQSRVADLVASIAGIAVLAAGVFIALGVVGADTAVTSLLAGVGIVGLALGLAFQSIASNFVAGVILLVRPPFRAGSLIETESHIGTVEEMTLRTTILRSVQGQLVHVPNSSIIQNPIINYSTGRRRVDLSVGVSYGDDLETVQRVTIDAVRTVPIRDPEQEVELFYEGFGDSAINLVVRFWISFERQADFMTARAEAVKRIKQAYDEHDITIPFPIRTLDFGIKGGETLLDQLGSRGTTGDSRA